MNLAFPPRTDLTHQLDALIVKLDAQSDPWRRRADPTEGGLRTPWMTCVGLVRPSPRHAHGTAASRHSGVHRPEPDRYPVRVESPVRMRRSASAGCCDVSAR